MKYVVLAVFALASLMVAGCGATRPAARESAQAEKPAATATGNAQRKALVVYFSYSGNTRALAKQIQQSTGGDLFELRPATPYSTDNDTVVSQGKREVETGYRPPLAAQVENLASYDVIFLGTPIWWYTIAPPVATFLAESDLAGKTIVPFVTHGGYGAGHSLDDIKKLAPKSTVRDVLSLRGGGSYDAKEIAAWLQKAGVAQ